MPRPTRIQYEHAFYHVMNRGRGRQTIFHGPDYYSAFLQTLAEAHGRFDAQLHSYCLMGNHYHLLIETPRANLDRIMRHVNGVYTQRHNRLKGTDGPLFRGRYKAILIDKDAYLLQVGRYIHRNPAEVKGAAADILDQYPWSSYLAYLNRKPAPAWLSREITYQMLGQRNRYEAYRAFVEQGNDAAFLRFYSKGNVASILGEKAFRAAIQEEREQLQVSGDLSRALSDRPDMTSIVAAVAKVFKTTPQEIVQRRTGRQLANLPRQMAIYCCQQLGDQSLKSLAAYFHLTHPGSVSPAVASIKERLKLGEMVEQYEKVKRHLNIIK